MGSGKLSTCSWPALPVVFQVRPWKKRLYFLDPLPGPQERNVAEIQTFHEQLLGVGSRQLVRLQWNIQLNIPQPGNQVSEKPRSHRGTAFPQTTGVHPVLLWGRG